jgi:hypothetical protein
MNCPLLHIGVCSPNTRRRSSWFAAALPNLTLLYAAALMPTTAAQSATVSTAAAAWFSVGQVDAVLPRATLLSPASSGPVRAEVLKQLYIVLPRAGLVATPLPRAPGIAAVTQPSVAGRLALHTPVLKPGQGPVLAAQGFSATDCSGVDSRTECRLPQAVPADEWQLATALEVDTVNGAAGVPGGTLNLTRSHFKQDEVLTYLASTAAKPGGVGLTSASHTVSGSGTPGGSSTSILLSPTSIFNLIRDGEYNTVAVDLSSASEASYVSGLTLSGYNTLLLIVAPGGILQLNNLTQAAGSPARQSSMVLSAALNGYISVLGGSTDGTGITKVATVRSLSVLQSGAADVVLLGFNGTTGTFTTVLQSGAGVKTLQLDNYTNDMLMNMSQTGGAAHTATGIVLKAAPGSSFVLAQQ